MKPSFLVAGVGLALVIIFLLQYWINHQQDQATDSSPVIEALTPAPQSLGSPPAGNPQALDEDGGEGVNEVNVAPLPPLPSLDDSDLLVRELLGAAAPSDEGNEGGEANPEANPEAAPAAEANTNELVWPGAWLAPEQLVRRAATLLDNASNGDYPKKQLQFLAPDDGFKAQRFAGGLRVDPSGYKRFDPLVAALQRVSPQRLARVYRRLQPLLETALGELGQRRSPDALVQAALAQISVVPQLSGDVILVRPSVLYQYKDKNLESMLPLQKQLLRMGPDNVAALQGYATEFAQALDLNAAQP